MIVLSAGVVRFEKYENGCSLLSKTPSVFKGERLQIIINLRRNVIPFPNGELLRPFLRVWKEGQIYILFGLCRLVVLQFVKMKVQISESKSIVQ